MTTSTARARHGRLDRRAAPSALVAAGLAFLTCIATPTPASAADAPPGRIMTMTRGMKIFGDAEYALINALVARDQTTLDALVDPTFEQRDGAGPGEPLPREDWITQAPREASTRDRLTQMAVHDEPGMAVVSFLLQRPGKGDAFVVDVWRKQADMEKPVLMIRYLSAAASPAARAARHVTGRPSAPVVDTKK